MQRQITRALDVGWQIAQLDPAQLYPGDRVQIARRAYDAAGLMPGVDPRMLAVALGFRLSRCAWLADCGGEVTDGAIILYRPHLNPRTEQCRVAHGLAHALLMREGWAHGESDALLLTSDLVSR